MALVFFLTGAVSASWAARVPAVKHGLDLSDADLALAFVGLNAGAVLGLPLGGALVPRLGSRTGLTIGFPLYALTLAAPALASDLGLLTARSAGWWVTAAAPSRPSLGVPVAAHFFGIAAGATLAGAAACRLLLPSAVDLAPAAPAAPGAALGRVARHQSKDRERDPGTTAGRPGPARLVPSQP